MELGATKRVRLQFAASLLMCSLAVPGVASASPRRNPVPPVRPLNPAKLQAAKQRAQARAMFSSPSAALGSPRSADTSAVVLGPLNQPGLAAADNTVQNDG